MYKLYWITGEGWNGSEGRLVFVVVEVIDLNTLCLIADVL